MNLKGTQFSHSSPCSEKRNLTKASPLVPTLPTPHQLFPSACSVSINHRVNSLFLSTSLN